MELVRESWNDYMGYYECVADLEGGYGPHGLFEESPQESSWSSSPDFSTITMATTRR